MLTDGVTKTRTIYRLIPAQDDWAVPVRKLPQRTLDLINAYEAVLKQQDVTHYFTLTAAKRISAELLRAMFKEWIDPLAWFLKRPIGWFRAEEFRWAGLGHAAIPLHFHGVLIGAWNLNIPQACHIWKELAGDAKIDIYQPSGNAIRYCLKQALTCTDYDLGGPNKAFRSFDMVETSRV